MEDDDDDEPPFPEKAVPCCAPEEPLAAADEAAVRERTAAFDAALNAQDIDAMVALYADGAVRMAIHRMRRRWGEILRDEISQTVEDPQQVEDELRHLFAVLDS